MAKRGVTRKQLLKEPDEFIAFTTRAIAWCRQYPKQLTYGACAIVAVVLIIVGYGFYRNSRSQAANSLLDQGLTKYFAEETNTEGTDDPGPDFERLVTRYGNLPAGEIGRVFFAHLNLNKGDLDEAIANYSKAMDAFSDDASLKNIFFHGLALANEEKGDVATAIGYFEKIARSESLILKDTALFHLGMLYEQTKENDKSLAAYEQLRTDFPGSLYAPMAQEKVSG